MTQTFTWTFTSELRWSKSKSRIGKGDEVRTGDSGIEIREHTFHYITVGVLMYVII